MTMKNIMRKFVLVILCLFVNTFLTCAPSVAEDFVQRQAPAFNIITVPAGTSFVAKMQSAVSSASLKAGDNIAATLNEDWVYNGKVIAPAGSILYGNAIQVEQAGRAYQNGELELRFNEIITPDGQSIPIASNTFAVGVDENRPLRIAYHVGKTGVAVAYDNILRGKVSDAKDLLKYVSIGIADGAIMSYVQKGNDVELPRNTLVKVKLSHDIKIIVYS